MISRLIAYPVRLTPRLLLVACCVRFARVWEPLRARMSINFRLW